MAATSIPGVSEFPDISSSEQQLLLMTAHAEANRSAAILLLHETCLLRLAKFHPKLQSSRSELLEDILSFAEMICSIGIITAALPIWAVFVAGCVVNEADQRQRVLKILDDFQSSKRYGSIPPACDILEVVWRQNDVKADENPRKARPTTSMQQAPTRNRRSHNFDILEDDRPLGKKSYVNLKQMQFSWESAMAMVEGLRLSLT